MVVMIGRRWVFVRVKLWNIVQLQGILMMRMMMMMQQRRIVI